MENNTSAEGALIKIKDPATNTTITTGITNSGDNISFISNQSIFNIEITYKNYKPYITRIEYTGTPPMANLNHAFVPSKLLKPTKMLVFLSGCFVGTVNLMINDIYKNQLLSDGYDFKLKNIQHGNHQHKLDRMANIPKRTKKPRTYYST